MSEGIAVRELFARLGLDLKEEEWEKGDKAIDRLKAGLAGLGAIVVGAATGLAAMIKATADQAGQINDLSKSVGVSTTALQELQHAAQLSGVGFEELVQSLTFLNRAAAGAAAGSAEQAKSFAELGIKVKDATGKIRPAEELLGDVAAKFATMPDGAQKTALAMQLFGRSGARLISFLSEGRDAIDGYRQEARDLGIVLGEDLVAAGDDLGDNLDRANASLVGLRNAIAGPLLKDTSELVVTFTAWVKANRAFIAARVHQYVLAFAGAVRTLWRMLLPALRLFAGVVHALGGFERALRATVTVLILATAAVAAYLAGMVLLQLNTMATVAGGILPMIKALASLALSLLATAAGPIALGAAFLGLAAIVALVAEDVYGFFNGSESLVGDFLYALDELATMMQGSAFDTNAFFVIRMLKEAKRLLVELQVAWGSFITAFSAVNRSVLPAYGLGNGTVTGAVARLAGLPDPAAFFGAGASPTTSAASSSATRGPTVVNAPMTANVAVHASTNASADEIAGHAKAAVHDALQTHLRETQAAMGSP